MTGRAYVGTSGFAYKEWKPSFYPQGVPQRAFLEHYATVLSTVEINNTFYRMPSESLLSGWRERTPEAFRFTLKAPRQITHNKRLADAEDAVSRFLTAARTLGDRLGMILFQCPPNLARDDALLTDFASSLPGAPFRFAMEFRHPSWDDDGVRDLMSKTGVAWCVAEVEGTATMHRTARGFSYLRLRKDAYTDAEIDAWAAQVHAAADDGADVYVYFKHEDEARAPAYAQRLLAALDA